MEVLNQQLKPVKAQSARALSFVLEEHLTAAQLLIDQHSQTAKLIELTLQDLQLDAHLDGLRVDSESAWKIISSALESAEVSTVFLATVLALEGKHTARLKQLLALAEANQALKPGVFKAFTWIPDHITRPLLPHLRSSAATLHQQLALHLCHQHHIRAETYLEWAITHTNADIRNMGLTAAGDTGETSLLELCLRAQQSDQTSTRYAAARAATLLGESTQSIRTLQSIALGDEQYQPPSLSLIAVFLPLDQAHSFLTKLRAHTSNNRLLVTVAGELGGANNVPALLRLMQDPKLARIAAFSFCFITGLDLVEHNMEANAPEDFETGPNDDPDDDNVESDPDEDLPWPDRNKLMQWWEQHGSSFKPGIRYLMGKEITREHCLDVLEFGNQAQRKIAALHLKKMDPASPLFLIDAPAWRQQARLQLLRNS
ncbi:MAG: hypothetical protein CMK89_08160 [Pseudomonadales bacterium]|nr:hypothetical protein [Pseudomonadales bacterium]